jgi:hypothetical protein
MNREDSEDDPREAPWLVKGIAIGLAISAVLYFAAAYGLIWIGHWICKL